MGLPGICFHFSTISPPPPLRSSVCFICESDWLAGLPRHCLTPSSSSLFFPLRINLIWCYLLFRTLTPYGQPPTQSTPSHFHENLKSSHIKYWCSSILTGCPGPCLQLEREIITYSSITNNLTWTSHVVKGISKMQWFIFTNDFFFWKKEKEMEKIMGEKMQ